MRAPVRVFNYSDESQAYVAPFFDYSAAEWRTIDREVQSARGNSLEQQDKVWLRQIATKYLMARSRRDAGVHRTPKQSAKSVERVIRLAAQLHHLIKSHIPNEECELIAEGLEGHLLALKELQELAKHSLPIPPRKAPIKKTRLDNPRLKYQTCVLMHWSCFCRGKLGVAHGRSGKVQGPLVRYFFAVVRPVMGASTPSAESLPDIVNYHKRFEAAADRSCGAGPFP